MTHKANHLLSLLPPKQFQELLSICEPVEMDRGAVLSVPDQKSQFAYFPLSGCVSLKVAADATLGLEVGMVGREGMVGTHLILGAANSYSGSVVHRPGAAWRVDAVKFNHLLASRSAVKRVFDLYVAVLLRQYARSAVCLRHHLFSERLARWLLMIHDRADRDRFNLTHEMMSAMLGVPRASVTRAASALQDAMLIEYFRGSIHVINRQGLELASCKCYQADLKSYVELLGTNGPPNKPLHSDPESTNHLPALTGIVE